jgi:glucuronoarabinoxylan endo-1,4-beta-xylanase
VKQISAHLPGRRISRHRSGFGAWIYGAVLLVGAVQCGSASTTSVTIEAESGVLGAEWTTGESGGVDFISITTDTINTGNPGSANRVATFTVTFPTAATYHLYARIRVGPANADDDSLFYANTFGEKSPTTSGDWIMANGLFGRGFNNPTDVVTGGGTLGSGMWKWINLSQFNGHPGFPVSAGNLTQTFQLGARENGLDIDKFVFGMAGVIYTVAALDAGLSGTLTDGVVTVNWNDVRQEIDGFGGGVVFLNDGSVLNSANADTLFKQDTPHQLGLTLLRVRIAPNNNWSNSVSAWNSSVNEARLAVQRGAGVLATPWTMPAYMKSNGDINNGGSLLPEEYANYAAYLEKYASNMVANGVQLTAIGVQNEPDWAPDYESCTWTATQLRNFFRTNASVITSAPLMMPESVGLNFALADLSLNDPSAVTNIGYVGYHLYGVLQIIPHLNAAAKGKKVWQTEYLINDQSMETSIQTARQIHDCLTVGNMSAYIWWKCLGTLNGLLNSSGVVQRRGFVMAQFSRFVRPGDYRMGENNQGSGAVSAYRNLTNNKYAIIAINSFGIALTQHLTLTNFPGEITLTPTITSATQSLVPLPAITVTNGTFSYVLPPNSIITFAGQAVLGPPGVASNPSPADGATGVVVGTPLTWTPGSNAVLHAVYLGINSNAVAFATPAAGEYQGTVAVPSLAPALQAETTYYWRVDEIAGAYTNPGPVWSFSAVAAPVLAHRYSFSETSGTIVADSIGGPAWNGTLPNGGVFGSGQLTLASANQRYVSLPASIVSTLTNFSIEAWVRLNSTANWTRIFDFGGNTATNMFLTPQNGENGRVRFAITTGGAGGEQRITAATATMSAGIWYHVAVTLNDNTGTLYLNGVPVGTNSAMTLRPASLGQTVNNWLGRSQYAGDAYLNSTFDEFRIHSIPLSAAEIAAGYALGPNQLLSTESPALQLLATPTNVTLTWPLASAGYTVQSRTNLLLGNWSNVPAPAPQIIGGEWQVTLPRASAPGETFYRLAK